MTADKMDLWSLKYVLALISSPHFFLALLILEKEKTNKTLHRCITHHFNVYGNKNDCVTLSMLIFSASPSLYSPLMREPANKIHWGNLLCRVLSLCWILKQLHNHQTRMTKLNSGLFKFHLRVTNWSASDIFPTALGLCRSRPEDLPDFWQESGASLSLQLLSVGFAGACRSSEPRFHGGHTRWSPFSLHPASRQCEGKCS